MKVERLLVICYENCFKVQGRYGKYLKYASIIIFVISSIFQGFFCNLCDLQISHDRFQWRLNRFLATWVIPGGQQVGKLWEVSKQLQVRD